MKYTRTQAKRILRDSWYHLSEEERDILENVLDRAVKPRDLNKEFTDQRSFGERLADRVAEFGGSWTFITIFVMFLLLWSVINTVILGDRAFDPYPYIFLNLLLSMVAAIQAPIIMMSQNRQGQRDRLDAEIDHEVNVRAELTLHHLNKHIRQMESKMNQMAHDMQNLTDQLLHAQGERHESSR